MLNETLCIQAFRRCFLHILVLPINLLSFTALFLYPPQFCFLLFFSLLFFLLPFVCLISINIFPGVYVQQNITVVEWRGFLQGEKIKKLGNWEKEEGGKEKGGRRRWYHKRLIERVKQSYTFQLQNAALRTTLCWVSKQGKKGNLGLHIQNLCVYNIYIYLYTFFIYIYARNL